MWEEKNYFVKLLLFNDVSRDDIYQFSSGLFTLDNLILNEKRHDWHEKIEVIRKMINKK